MELLQKILVSSIMIILIFLVYKFVLNPEVIPTQTLCPTGWKFNDPLCVPTYETICKSFDPSKMTSKIDRMLFSKRCGVQWN
jgi:hypothetical protein